MAEEIGKKGDVAHKPAPDPADVPDTVFVPMHAPEVHAAPEVAPAKSSEPELIAPLRFEFTGTGEEYFRIWIVNLLFTVLTVGVYSAWAKVRRLQYFYRNTRLDGAIFDYHGDPKAILKGRILALVLLGVYKFSIDISIVAAMLAGLVLAGIMPWLLANSFRFNLANTSYRGVNFRFQGKIVDAYRTLILFPVVLIFTGLFIWSVVISHAKSMGAGSVIFLFLLALTVLGGTIPLAHYFLKRYQHDNAYFGQTPFFFFARPVEFFKSYGIAIGVFVGGLIVAAILGRLLSPVLGGILFVVSFYALFLFARANLESRVQNLVWSKTDLGDHHFESTIDAGKLFKIHASNFVLIVVTLGLYKPFAAIRLAKYRLENLALLPQEILEDFVTDPEPDQAGATGQEAGDLFNIDIAL